MGQAKNRGPFEYRVIQAKARELKLKREAEELCIARHKQECLAYDMMDDTQYELSAERDVARQRRRSRMNATTAMLMAAYASVCQGERW